MQVCKPWLSVGVLLFLVSACVAQEVKPTGSIRGQLLDSRGKIQRDSVFVFLCDGRTGWPIVSRNQKVVSRSNMTARMADFRHVRSTKGAFEFEQIPQGDYRLVAQAWENFDGIPTKTKDLRKDYPLVVYGHARVRVTPNKAARVSIRGLGDAVMLLKTDPDEGNAFLFPTVRKPIGDFVLGPFAWRDFGTDVLGMTHMSGGKVLVKGLPNQSPLHFCYMNYDNNAGSGGGSGHTGRDVEVTMNVYATWSNGKYDPPARLLPLVKYIEDNKLSLAEVTGRRKTAGREHVLVTELLQDPEKKITVGTIGEWSVIDLVAANTYRALRRSHAARRAQQK